MASAATLGPHASDPEPLTRSALATEAIGSALLCSVALVGARVVGDATIEREPVLVIVTVASVAVFAFVTIRRLSKERGAALVPNGAYAQAVEGSLSRAGGARDTGAANRRRAVRDSDRRHRSSTRLEDSGTVDRKRAG